MLKELMSMMLNFLRTSGKVEIMISVDSELGG